MSTETVSAANSGTAIAEAFKATKRNVKTGRKTKSMLYSKPNKAQKQVFFSEAAMLVERFPEDNASQIAEKLLKSLNKQHKDYNWPSLHKAASYLIDDQKALGWKIRTRTNGLDQSQRTSAAERKMRVEVAKPEVTPARNEDTFRTLFTAFLRSKLAEALDKPTVRQAIIQAILG